MSVCLSSAHQSGYKFHGTAVRLTYFVLLSGYHNQLVEFVLLCTKGQKFGILLSNIKYIL